MSRGTFNITIRKAAITAGLCSIIMFFAAIIAEFYTRQELIVVGDADATAINIINNPTSFRAGILGFIIVLICDVLVSWALYIFLNLVNKDISLLAAIFRLVYTAIFGVVLLNLITGFRLLTETRHTINSVNSQALLLFNTFDDGWAIGLLFFGIHLLILGYLIIKSTFIPKFIGILLLIASTAYLTDNLAKLFLADYTSYKTLLTVFVAIPSILGEAGFAVWLLIKGRKLTGTELIS